MVIFIDFENVSGHGFWIKLPCYFLPLEENPRHLIAMIIAPTVIALSAILNTGHTLRSIKSITYPKKMRSIRLPIVPPNINENPRI